MLESLEKQTLPHYFIYTHASWTARENSFQKLVT